MQLQGPGDTAVWESTYQGLYLPQRRDLLSVAAGRVSCLQRRPVRRRRNHTGGCLRVRHCGCGADCGAAGKLSGRNAGYADRGCTVGRPGAAAGAQQLFRQEGCTLPADAAVREYGDILFVDTGVQDSGKYWAYGEQYGRALRCPVSGQPSAIGLYYCGGTEAPITIETPCGSRSCSCRSCMRYCRRRCLYRFPQSRSHDHRDAARGAEYDGTISRRTGASEEIPAPGSAVSTGIKAYDSINGCVVVKVDTVKKRYCGRDGRRRCRIPQRGHPCAVCAGIVSGARAGGAHAGRSRGSRLGDGERGAVRRSVGRAVRPHHRAAGDSAGGWKFNRHNRWIAVTAFQEAICGTGGIKAKPGTAVRSFGSLYFRQPKAGRHKKSVSPAFGHYRKISGGAYAQPHEPAAAAACRRATPRWYPRCARNPRPASSVCSPRHPATSEAKYRCLVFFSSAMLRIEPPSASLVDTASTTGRLRRR